MSHRNNTKHRKIERSEPPAAESEANEPIAEDIMERFEIPVRDDDMLLPNVAYRVERELEHEDVLEEMQTFQVSLNDDDWKAIFTHFDALFYLCKYNSHIQDWPLRLNVVRLLLRNLEILKEPIVETVSSVLGTDGLPPIEVSTKCGYLLDSLCMTVYLLYRSTCHLEDELKRRLQANSINEKRGRQATVLNNDDEMFEWDRLRRELIQSLTWICEFKMADAQGCTRKNAIRYLFRKPMDGKMLEAKPLVRCLTELAVKFLSLPFNGKSAARPWLTIVFGLVRAVCTEFDRFSVECTDKIVDKTFCLDYLREVVGNHPYVDPLIDSSSKEDMQDDGILVQMFNRAGATARIFEEKGDKVDEKLKKTRQYTTFVQTVAQRCPALVCANLSALQSYLSSSLHSFRSAALQAFCEILSSDYMSPQQCIYERQLKARDNMLLVLQAHLYDSNNNVRQKSLNVFTKLAGIGRIPLSTLNRALISDIGMRLVDKYLMVRKSAIGFMTEFLQKNPFGHDFDYALHMRTLKERLQERDRLRKKNPHGQEQAEAVFEDLRADIRILARSYVEKFKELGHEDIEAPRDMQTNLINLRSVTRQLNDNCEKVVKIYARLVLSGCYEDVDPSTSSVDDLVEAIETQLEEAYLYKPDDEEEEAEMEVMDERNIEQYEEKMQRLDATISALINKLVLELEFEACMSHAIRAVLQGDLSEMKEGIKFVIECKLFAIRGADKAVRALCGMIWRGIPDVTKEVISAAEKMFFSENKKKSVRDSAASENLIAVIDGMAEEERACFEEVICRMATSNPFSPGVIANLWEVAKTSLESTEKTEKGHAALRMLSILAKADKRGLVGRLRGFQRFIREGSTQLAIEAVAAIANLATESKAASPDGVRDPILRVPSTDSLFPTIEKLVIQEFLRPGCKHWLRVVKTTLGVYFDVAKDTNLVLVRLCGKMLFYVRRVSAVYLAYVDRSQATPPEELNDDQHGEAQAERAALIAQRRRYYSFLWCHMMERFMIFCGELAMRTVIHVDSTYVQEARQLGEIVNNAALDPMSLPMAPDRDPKRWELRCALRKGVFDFVANTDKENITGLTDFDRVMNRSEHIMNRRLLHGGRLLQRLLPIVVFGVRGREMPKLVRNAASLAYAKFLLVSTDMAAIGAYMFFHLLNNSKSPVVRNNLMISAGDFCVRHPNVVERFSNEMYGMVNDKDASVRETALLILMHLTTKGMLKHRGALSDSARLMIDPVPSISSTAKTFFEELSAKNHTVIQNSMPEFITRLSHNSHEVPLGEFKKIMQQLFQLLKGRKTITGGTGDTETSTNDSSKPDKPLDALLEKICRRFEFAKNGHALQRNKDLAAYYSYCISQIPLNDRCLGKMLDTQVYYMQFLEDPRVLHDFVHPVQDYINKTTNIELKSQAMDFVEQMKKVGNSGLKQSDVDKARQRRIAGSASKRQASSASRRGRGAGAKTVKKPRKLRYISEEDSGDSN